MWIGVHIILSLDTGLQGGLYYTECRLCVLQSGVSVDIFSGLQGVYIILSVGPGLQGGLYLTECRLCIYKAKLFFENILQGNEHQPGRKS